MAADTVRVADGKSESRYGISIRFYVFDDLNLFAILPGNVEIIGGYYQFKIFMLEFGIQLLRGVFF